MTKLAYQVIRQFCTCIHEYISPETLESPNVNNGQILFDEYMGRSCTLHRVKLAKFCRLPPISDIDVIYFLGFHTPSAMVIPGVSFS